MSRLREIGDLQVQHLTGGTRPTDPIAELGSVPENPDSAHGSMTMSLTVDQDIIKDTIMETFSKQSRQPGFGLNRDTLRFQAFDNGDGTMTVVFDAG